jgi:hypothetical protein
MKPVNQVTCVVVDYGTLGISLAQKLAETMKKVYFYSPTDDEFKNVKDCVLGIGVPGVTRLEDFLDPKVFDEIDLFVFPDIGWGPTQKFLRERCHKAVWGSMGADSLELSRTKFLEFLKSIDLPMAPSEVIVGLGKLEEYLKDKKDKWIKVDRFRGNMETWHHIDAEHSSPILDGLAEEFQGVKEHVTFVVQDPIKTDVEIGYDGWTVDGKFPAKSFQGYEKKNELYLGSLLAYDELPDPIKEINGAISDTLAKYGYRNFVATEIRVKDDVPYFIDPTFRMPGQTGEQLQETCSNLADVIWQGANGLMIEPEFVCKFVAEATLHYTAGDEEWRVIRVPEEVRQWVKLYRYCIIDDVYHFPPAKNDELGVVLGIGNTIEEAVDNLKNNLELLKDEPLLARTDGFKDLIEKIQSAQKEGIKFSKQPLPKPEEL